MQGSTALLNKKCVPCEGGTEPLKGDKLSFYTPVVPDWTVVDEVKITKDFIFKDFKEALRFLNQVGKIAEAERHHPDLNLHNYRKVQVSLSTHAIHGLSENDFIMAVKIDQLLSKHD